MYVWKNVLPTKGLEYEGLPCARKVAVSMLLEVKISVLQQVYSLYKLHKQQ